MHVKANVLIETDYVSCMTTSVFKRQLVALLVVGLSAVKLILNGVKLSLWILGCTVSYCDDGMGGPVRFHNKAVV